MSPSAKKLLIASHVLEFCLYLASSLPLCQGALNPTSPIERLHQDVWDTDRGLPQNTVLSILQSRDGYIWFGTELGLVRFDGVRFTVFDKSNVPALRSNVVDALLEGRNGDIWIGTIGGGLTRYSRGSFTTFGAKDGLANDTVLSLLEDRAGNLWIGTEGGLNHFSNGRFSTFDVKNGLSNNEVFALAQSASGEIWIGTHSGLNLLTPKGIHLYEEQSALTKAYIKSLFIDRQGSLWIGIYGSGLMNISNGKSALWTTADGLSSNAVTTIKDDSAGSLWIGTIGGGLNRKVKDQFTSYTTQKGLPINDVWCLLEDRQSNLWIGMGGAGLARLSEGKLFRSYGMREGLAASGVLPIFEDREHNVWIGTNGGGLDRFHNGEITHFTTNDGLADNLIFTICEDAEGYLWVGTRKGVSRFKGNRFTTLTVKDGLPADIAFASYADREGNVWLGTRAGLAKWRDGKFTTYTTSDGLSNNVIQFISQDHNGAFWIGTAGGGLNKFENGKFKVFDARHGLSNGFVWCMHESSDGTLWFGTNGGGLYRFRDGHFVSYTIKDGLLDDAVFEILEDDSQNLWMSSNKGVFRVSIPQLNDFAEKKISSINTVEYGSADGLNTRECNGGFQPAGLKSQDGKLWFPTMKGVAVVDPRKASVPEPPPPTTIEAAVVDHRSVNPTAGALLLPPGRGDLEIAYSAPSFNVPEKTTFRYLLEGFDREWVEAGTRRNAYYTKVPPGSYKFHVIASIAGGKWGSSAQSLPITLEAHFYQTVWFYAICTLAVVLAAFGANWIYLRYLAERRELLELLIYRKTGDLRREIAERQQIEKELQREKASANDANKLQKEFLTNMSDEIRTPIQSIIGANESALTTQLTPEQRRHLVTIKQSAVFLLNRLNDFLDFKAH
jgi:ligand-binding sensor domain-containing protein